MLGIKYSRNTGGVHQSDEVSENVCEDCALGNTNGFEVVVQT